MQQKNITFTLYEYDELLKLGYVLYYTYYPFDGSFGSEMLVLRYPIKRKYKEKKVWRYISSSTFIPLHEYIMITKSAAYYAEGLTWVKVD